ncbi:hypothetical protein LA02_147 [Francisella philomiragia]|uniref:FTL_1709 family lipoprotein n=1 Tax=Francisella philomiragia TaxID=28110 RepID=UPI0005A56A2C|nr:hypothetical protein [Francisella philomiragia]AJI57751.1 hypothetical protein LA02_147 [Francisella philomiragia]MBK2296389.1 hypothetical protein [Francisella philomiragia]MBK2340856.1 hypothetical protein [Francisella philomiragia]QUE31653.1 hypothetical protein IMS64_01195 [Francisella philomiragia]
MIKIFFSRKFLVVLLLSVSFLLSGCSTTGDGYQGQVLPIIKHGHSKKKQTAYNIYGFKFENTPSGIYNILDKKPTEFLVNVYVGDNYGCKFTYTMDKEGKKEEITKTSSFVSYLSGSNELLKLECKGEDSNIDYKIVVYANNVEYDKVGNLSYLAASGGL